MPENSTEGDEGRFYDSDIAEDEAPRSCSPSSSALETVSISSPHATKRAEFCVNNSANTTSPRVLPASDFSSNKLSSMNVRKFRRKHHVEAFEKSPVLGVVQNGSSRNWISSTKSRVPKCQSKGSKQQHVMGKSFHMAKEVVGDSNLSSEQVPCLNGDLHSDYLVNAPRPLKGIHASGGDVGNYCCTFDSLESSSRKEFGSGYDAISVKQEGVLSSYLHTHLLAWFSGLFIRALRSQWNFMFQMLLSLMLAWYQSFLFALHPLNYMLHARAKATEAYRSKEFDSEKLGRNLQRRALVVRPTLALGARKLAFGSLTALYTLSMLTCLFVASLMLSFSVVKGFVYEPVQLYEYLFFDYTKQLPVASLDFTESMMDPNTGSLFRRLSRPTRNFRATVYLTVPESDFNKELGIFQVTAELISATGRVLLSKTQPCMLQFRSTALQHVKAFLMALPLLAGSYLETQTLVVSSLKWQEQSAFSSAALRVVLAPRSGRPLLSGLPELYEAGVSVESELPLWVRLVGNWRWTLSVWLGLALFIGVVVIILGLCTQFLLPDLGRVFSIIFKGLGKRESFMVKAAHHKLGRLSSELALGSDSAEFVNDDTT